MNVILSDEEWAEAQWENSDLGDKRRTKRAVKIGGAMASNPSASLPDQMNGNQAAPGGAYGLLNNKHLTLDMIARWHWEQTLEAAREYPIVLFIQDTTERNYTHHPTKEGLGPIGNGFGRGLLLHSTTAVLPFNDPQVLGLAVHSAFLRQPTPQPRPRDYTSPEGLAWTEAAKAVGRAPEGAVWVHVCYVSVMTFVLCMKPVSKGGIF